LRADPGMASSIVATAIGYSVSTSSSPFGSTTIEGPPRGTPRSGDGTTY
jgi:hypothetical protein